MVDCVRVEVYAGSLAVPLAFAAVLALFRVYVYLEERLLADEAEQSSDWANRVAPSASVLPSQYCDDAQGEQSDHECRDALEPDLNLVEGITAEML